MAVNAEKTAVTPPAAPRRRLRLRMGDELALLQLIVVALIIGSLLHPAFLTEVNLVNILQQSSELSVLVLAEAIILIVGKFDLSLESIVGVAPMLAGWLVLDTSLNGSGLMSTPTWRSRRSSWSASPSAPSTASSSSGSGSTPSSPRSPC